MGNDTSKKQHLESKHENLDLKISHEKFQHFKYHEAEDLIQITTQVESQKDIKAWDNDLRRLNAFEDKEALLIPVRHEFTPKGFCGNVGSVKIFYQNYPYLFEEEIENRINMNKHFQEEQLWYLLYSLVSSARDFNSIDRQIGDVRPYNIFINEEGQIKIANIFSWPYEKTSFQKTAFEKQLTYLSPEEMRLVSKGNHQDTTNKVLSESFSIGLTLLQSGLLFNVKQLYSVQHYSFDLQKLNQKLNEWQNLQLLYENNTYSSYSQLLKGIVVQMCSPDQNSRLSSLVVQNILRPYQNEILNLKQFDHRHIHLPGENQPVPLPVQNRPVQSNPSVLPQQTTKVNNQLDYKSNSQNVPQSIPNGAGINVIHFGNQQPRFTVESPPVQIYEQQFSKYATLNTQPPAYQATQFEPNAYKTQLPTQHSQQFQKYASLNQNITSNTSTNPGSLIPAGNISSFNTVSSQNNTYYQAGVNLPAVNFSQNAYNQPVFPQTTFTTSNYTPVGFNSQFSRAANVVQTSSQVAPFLTGPTLPPANDNSSDFLRKIDEQLEHSRRQFPT